MTSKGCIILLIKAITVKLKALSIDSKNGYLFPYLISHVAASLTEPLDIVHAFATKDFVDAYSNPIRLFNLNCFILHYSHIPNAVKK